MSQFQTSMMALVAKERFSRVTLPPGVNRNDYNNYIDSLARAVGYALSQWQQQSVLTGVQIMANMALGGTMRGPSVEPFIRAQAPAGNWDVHTRAIAAGLAGQLHLFQQCLRVPGLPWYPAFIAFPGPMAPPMPNVPCSLMALAGQAMAQLSEHAVKAAIITKLPQPRPTAGEELAGAVAAGFEKAAVPWVGTVTVKNVMGTGPVPTFAPPYVPVGPVVGGTGTMLPGGLL
ncbi:MAG: hypothetical protein KF778_10875 [Rhodocyclaceae bacterium]|nr:hypothetical protein [Rhodocyclaceae bacterium]MBX3668896.1 hypothetical protein [Rhodocyclaceae bacterium]